MPGRFMPVALTLLVVLASGQGVASATGSVYLTAPQAGATITGTRVTVASHSDEPCDDYVLQVDGVYFSPATTTSGYSASGSDQSFVIDSTKISNGPHQFNVVGKLCYGSAPPNSIVSNFTVRNTGPSVAITSPVEGGTVDGTSFHVTADAVPDPQGSQTIKKVDFFLDNGDTGPTNSDDLAPYDIVIDAGAIFGQHKIWARAVDTSGLVTTSVVVTFTVGNRADGVYLTSPSAGSTITGVSVRFTSQAERISCDQYDLKVDGQYSDAVKREHSPTSAEQQFTLDATKFPDGSHAFVIVASRCYGGTSDYRTDPVTLTVRNVAPTVAITSPTNNSVVTGQLQVSVDAQPDPQGRQTIKRVELHLDGPSGPDDFPIASDDLAPYLVTVNTASLRSGIHTLRAVAFDSAGLAATSAPLSVTVQNYALRTSPAYARIARGSNVTFSTGLVDGGAAVGGKTLSIYVRGPGATLFHLSRQVTTDGAGMARATYLRPGADFRWYVVYASAGRRTTSPVGLVQVR